MKRNMGIIIALVCDNDKYKDRIILEDENGIKTYAKDIYDERCLEGKKSTLYYNDTYTCTKCKNPYILSYSDFYEKKNLQRYI